MKTMEYKVNYDCTMRDTGWNEMNERERDGREKKNDDH